MAKNETTSKIVRIALASRTAANLSDAPITSLSNTNFKMEHVNDELRGPGFDVTPLSGGKPVAGKSFFVPMTNVAAVFYG